MLKIIKFDMEVNRTVAYVTIFLLLLLLLPTYDANCQDYIEYKIRVDGDGSAGWLITIVSDINAPIDSWSSFQTRIYDLVDSAQNVTSRQMDIDAFSIQINTTISASSKITEYMFIWLNFSLIQNGELVFGDIFRVNDFFRQLYGDSSLQIEYPEDLAIESLNLDPYFRDDSAHVLKYRTQDLTSNQVNIAMKIQPSDSGLNGNSNLDIIIGSAVIAIVAVLLIILIVSRRRKTGVKNVGNEAVAEPIKFENEEDKILNVLRSGGKSMRQSDITEQCKFSKAKTSQLLTNLEDRGIIRRYKKGRDKIVTLNESGQGE